MAVCECSALRATGPLPIWLNPQPSTLNPQLSTFNPQPSTLNSQPLTPNPQPSTLNPQPSILNQVSLADLRGTGQDEVGREEARVRDRMREFFPDAKQAIDDTSYYVLLLKLLRIHMTLQRMLITK